MYERILVPTDGSGAARAAAAEALDLGAEFGAELYAVYVIDESASNLFVSRKSVDGAIDEMARRGRTAVAEIETMADEAGVPVTTDVIRGTHINEAIVDYAAANDIDLVVMGTFGRRGVEHLVGSTTERVLANSSVPVLAVSVAQDADVDERATGAEETTGVAGSDRGE